MMTKAESTSKSPAPASNVSRSSYLSYRSHLIDVLAYLQSSTSAAQRDDTPSHEAQANPHAPVTDDATTPPHDAATPPLVPASSSDGSSPAQGQTEPGTPPVPSQADMDDMMMVDGMAVDDMMAVDDTVGVDDAMEVDSTSQQQPGPNVPSDTYQQQQMQNNMSGILYTAPHDQVQQTSSSFSALPQSHTNTFTGSYYPAYQAQPNMTPAPYYPQTSHQTYQENTGMFTYQFANQAQQVNGYPVYYGQNYQQQYQQFTGYIAPSAGASSSYVPPAPEVEMSDSSRSRAPIRPRKVSSAPSNGAATKRTSSEANPYVVLTVSSSIASYNASSISDVRMAIGEPFATNEGAAAVNVEENVAVNAHENAVAAHERVNAATANGEENVPAPGPTQLELDIEFKAPPTTAADEEELMASILGA